MSVRRDNSALGRFGSSRPSSSSSNGRRLPPLYGVSKMSDYKFNGRLGQGSFGVVFNGFDNRAKKLVAIKLILQKTSENTFPVTAFREIEVLKYLRYIHIVELLDLIVDVPPPEFFFEHLPKNGVLYKKEKSVFMVFPYMSYDLCGILRNDSIHLTESDRKSLMVQLFKGINFIHQHHYLHRDIKAANLLINHEGVLKIGDFGLAKHYNEPLPTYDTPGGGRAPLTEIVMTRWYRAPEVLFGNRMYTTAIDLWGIGCVLGELYEKTPIMNGNSDLNQAYMIFDLVGIPDERTPMLKEWTIKNNARLPPPKQPQLESRFGDQMSSECLDLLKQLLTLDPMKRITAEKALDHPWFKAEPLPTETISHDFPDCHESDVPATKARSRNQPSQPQPPVQSTSIALLAHQPSQQQKRNNPVNYEEQNVYSSALPYHPHPQHDQQQPLPPAVSIPTPSAPVAAGASYNNGIDPYAQGGRPKKSFISRYNGPSQSSGFKPEYPARDNRYRDNNHGSHAYGDTPPRNYQQSYQGHQNSNNNQYNSKGPDYYPRERPYGYSQQPLPQAHRHASSHPRQITNQSHQSDHRSATGHQNQPHHQQQQHPHHSQHPQQHQQQLTLPLPPGSTISSGAQAALPPLPPPKEAESRNTSNQQVTAVIQSSHHETLVITPNSSSESSVVSTQVSAPSLPAVPLPSNPSHNRQPYRQGYRYSDHNRSQEFGTPSKQISAINNISSGGYRMGHNNYNDRDNYGRNRDWSHDNGKRRYSNNQRDYANSNNGSNKKSKMDY